MHKHDHSGRIMLQHILIAKSCQNASFRNAKHLQQTISHERYLVLRGNRWRVAVKQHNLLPNQAQHQCFLMLGLSRTFTNCPNKAPTEPIHSGQEQKKRKQRLADQNQQLSCLTKSTSCKFNYSISSRDTYHYRFFCTGFGPKDLADLASIFWMVCRLTQRTGTWFCSNSSRFCRV